MTRGWDDVVARARGLASRLLGRGALEHLALSRDFNEVVRALDGTTYATLADVGTPRAIDLERQTRRIAGDRLCLIATWAAERAELLAPLFEDEDRRNLRAITHGIAAHTAPDQIVAGLLPTPTLPFPSLQALGGEARIQDVAATLIAWGNPYGRVMMPEATRATPDLFALQLAVDREFAARAVPIASRAGDPMLWFTRLLVDAENARAALAVSLGSVEHAKEELFIEGGERIDQPVFQEVAASAPVEARMRLAHLLGGTVLAPVVSSVGDERDGAMLTALLRELRHAVRVNPLSLYVVIEYVLALRAELQDLARILWGIALQVPRRRIANRLVTP